MPSYDIVSRVTTFVPSSSIFSIIKVLIPNLWSAISFVMTIWLFASTLYWNKINIIIRFKSLFFCISVLLSGVNKNSSYFLGVISVCIIEHKINFKNFFLVKFYRILFVPLFWLFILSPFPPIFLLQSTYFLILVKLLLIYYYCVRINLS